MKWMSRILMIALLLAMASVASAETVDLPSTEADQTLEAVEAEVTVDLQLTEEPLVSTVPQTQDLFTDTQYDIDYCGFPPPQPPPSCICGGCCECNRCWRSGVSLAKCLDRN